ncbi:hypothetical protein JTE90_000460 [Oedothorax gibbosus]|uniref:Uncharacterized protein n=1 Tax=Oedothorax gibbosus TaxID=931172 RepID=A0AAV6U439_9ARAC|nr:hypothetical protein JTE90_000460 [Oedothorax gibbosus]
MSDSHERQISVRFCSVWPAVCGVKPAYCHVCLKPFTVAPLITKTRVLCSTTQREGGCPNRRCVSVSHGKQCGRGQLGSQKEGQTAMRGGLSVRPRAKMPVEMLCGGEKAFCDVMLNFMFPDYIIVEAIPGPLVHCE